MFEDFVLNEEEIDTTATKKSESEEKYTALKMQSKKLEKAFLALSFISISASALSLTEVGITALVRSDNMNSFYEDPYYIKEYYEATKLANEKFESGEYTTEEYNGRMKEINSTTFTLELIEKYKDSSYQQKQNAADTAIIVGLGLCALSLTVGLGGLVCDAKKKQNFKKMNELECDL